ncbi:MAG: FtsQ-type POTRA domain-containing protein [Deltaproteobacteria bacterium]|nr:FtsQ-type POTRA domain-containing protein [Deltaproteobacteria bacterium]
MRSLVLKIIFLYSIFSLFAVPPVYAGSGEGIVEKVKEYLSDFIHEDVPENWRRLKKTLAQQKERVIKNLEERKEQVKRNLFRVKVSEISGLSRLSEKRIKGTLAAEREVWLWDLAFGKARGRLGRDPWISDARIHWLIFPLRVKIEVVEEEPWMVAEYNGESWLVSGNGVVIESLRALEQTDAIVESSELARITGLEENTGMVGTLSSSDSRLKQAIKLLHLIEAAGGLPFKVEQYRLLENGGLEASPREADQHPSVIIPVCSEKELSTSLRQLRVALNDLQNKNERAKVADLRFKNRVVVTPADRPEATAEQNPTDPKKQNKQSASQQRAQ